MHNVVIYIAGTYYNYIDLHFLIAAALSIIDILFLYRASFLVYMNMYLPIVVCCGMCKCIIFMYCCAKYGDTHHMHIVLVVIQRITISCDTTNLWGCSCEVYCCIYQLLCILFHKHASSMFFDVVHMQVHCLPTDYNSNNCC